MLRHNFACYYFLFDEYLNDTIRNTTGKMNNSIINIIENIKKIINMKIQ